MTARQHLGRIVGGDIGGEQLGLTGLVLGPLHGVGHQPHGLLQRREDLIALGLVVLDEIAAKPELIAGIGEGLGTQAQLRLDDGADHHAAILLRPFQHPPHIGDVAGRAVEQLQVFRGDVEIDHLGVFDVRHALIVADGQRQERRDHGAAVDDVAVEQIDRIGDLHQFELFIDLIDQGIDAAGEVIGGADLHIGAGR